jgi:arsenate reductase
MPDRPTVHFACVHNAGRSQMAAALMEREGGGRIEVRSAGTEPASEVHPVVVEAMAELGLDVGGERPKKLTDEAASEADVVVTMGCGDECPFYPGKRYEDWELDDPAGLDLVEVRAIRDEIGRRVKALAGELLAAPERA